jgi:hypothetical protein
VLGEDLSSWLAGFVRRRPGRSPVLQICSVGTWSFDIVGFSRRGPDRSRRLIDLLVNFTRRGSSRSLRLADLFGGGGLGRLASQTLLHEDLVNRIGTVVTCLLWIPSSYVSDKFSAIFKCEFICVLPLPASATNE